MRGAGGKINVLNLKFDEIKLKKQKKSTKEKLVLNCTLKHNRFCGMQRVFPKHRLTFDVRVFTATESLAPHLSFDAINCISSEVVDETDVCVS